MINRPRFSPFIGILALTLVPLSACQQTAVTQLARHAPRVVHPLAEGLPKGRTRGTIDLPTIQLVSGGLARTTFRPTRIDTTTFPNTRQGRPWSGATRRPGTMLPPHHRDKTLQQDPPNGLVASGMLDEHRIVVGPLFPTLHQTPWTPPDPSLAVGPDHLVVTVNMAVGFYDHDGNELFFSNLDSTGDPGFFEDVGSGDFTFDPKCFYDPFIERFVILALEVYLDTDEGWITIAVSDDSDPNGIWHKYRTWAVITNGGAEFWPDYPGFGFDSNAFYVTTNMFGFQGGFTGVMYRMFPKAPMLNGEAVTVTDLLDDGSGSVQVAQCLDPRESPLFLSRQSNSRIRVQSIEEVQGEPQLKTIGIDVPAFQSPNSDAPNLGGGTIDTLDGRLMNVAWRESGLWTAHAVRGTGGNTKARWYRFDDAGFPAGGTPTLIESGDVDLGAGVYTFFPAIATNGLGDTAMVLARSSADQHASIMATGRTQDDPPGTMGTPTQLAIGTAGTEGRWGDYFDITVDPDDDNTFWMVGEYATTFDGETGWQTWVGTLRVSCPGDVTGDGFINVNDILFVIGHFGDIGSAGDANGDGVVDVIDLLLVIQNWGIC